MRRGLIARSQHELSDAALDARVGAAQRAMARAGVDALLVYTNHTCPAGAWWFSGFVPYWSESALVVSRSGPPQLVTALSKRVHDWVERSARVGAVHSAPRLGTGVARVVAETKRDAVLAVAELRTLPDGLVADLRAGGPAITLVDAQERLGTLHARADDAERALAVRAKRIAEAALDAACAETSADAVVASAEYAARNAGAEEVYLALAADLDRERRFARLNAPGTALGATFAVRAAVAYKGVWVRTIRTVSRDARRLAAANEATSRLAEAARRLPAVDALGGATWWLIEASSGSQPLEPALGSMLPNGARLAEGSLVTLSAVFEAPSGRVAIGAPAIVGEGLL